MSEGNSVAVEDRLLQAIVEQLKLPFMQIAQLSELSRLTNKPSERLQSIELTAENALRFIDNYILSNQLVHQQLELEVVSLGSVLVDTADELQPFAQHYNCDIDLHICGKYEPVIANKAGLQATLSSLGCAFIEAQPYRGKKRPRLTLAAHRGKKGIVAGLFTELEGLSVVNLRRARALQGRARQPLKDVTAGNGAGVFVADSILEAMSAHLRVARHHNLTGLAATFKPSRQLSLAIL